MQKPSVARVNGWLCLSWAEVGMARRNIDPAPPKNPPPAPVRAGIRV